jgi:hypothetical protein
MEIMPTPTYELLTTTTLSTSTASITLSNLPQTSGHLFITMMANVASSRPYFGVNNNGSSGVYKMVVFNGNGSSPSSTSFSRTEILAMETIGSNYRSGHQLRINDYSSTTKKKSFFYTGQASDSEDMWIMGGEINITDAITRLDIFSDGSGTPFTTGTTVSVWGLAI